MFSSWPYRGIFVALNDFLLVKHELNSLINIKNREVNVIYHVDIFIIVYLCKCVIELL